jgi:hypothetical protein
MISPEYLRGQQKARHACAAALEGGAAVCAREMCYRVRHRELESAHKPKGADALPAAIETRRVEVPFVRSEEEIFDDLLGLCSSPGYVHALAMLCFRDNFIRFGRQLKAEDMDHLFSRSRLIRTEITTLVGLLIRKPIDFRHPGGNVLQDYINRTETLLDNLHQSMVAVMMSSMFGAAAKQEPPVHPDLSGSALREPIFYGGESAYGFQYRDLAEKKYGADDPWLLGKMGFSIADARNVVAAVAAVQDRKVRTAHQALRSLPRESWTVLPGFIFTAAEVAERAGVAIGTVERVLDAFAFPDGDVNAGFTSLHAYNAASGTPLLRKGAAEYVLLQQYSLFGALYESPFFWLGADKTYEPKAHENRGRFTEAFAFERLAKVFGTGHVHTNVDVWKSKGSKLGEIDVLLLFGDRAVVLQAKSKRLTLEARKGNDLQIKDDFKKAVQASYNQAYLCAGALAGPNPNLTDAAGQPISLREPVKVIYPVCIVADHYPALAFQARQFLKTQPADKLATPLVTDVFALDAMTEMLESPLRLLSYLELRARFGDRLMATHELTLLSFHLKRNLWLNEDYDFAILEDGIAADLDVAMSARREGLPGARTPDGILTRIRNTAVGNIIAEIEAEPDASTIDLGLLLLELSEETVETLSRGIRQITAATRRDGKKHDITIELGKSSAGLTIHCNPGDLLSAQNSLRIHCEGRKYSQKANRWFGLAVKPDGSLWFGLKLEFPWVQDARMERLMHHWPKATARPAAAIGTRAARKIGRNTPCPCGSGKKYKRCCMPR